MRLTKRQLKRIIREEYSRLQKKGLIRETSHMKIDDITEMIEDFGEAFVDTALAEMWFDDNESYYPGITIKSFAGNMSRIMWPKWRG